MLRHLAATLVLLTAAPTITRAVSLQDDAQVWAPAFVNLPSQGRLVGLLELQPRVRGDFRRISTAIVRPWIGWRLAPGAFLHAGYGWIRSDTANVTTEHRAWQQLQRTVSPTPNWRLTARARLEQRWLQNVPETAWRARVQLRAERVLGSGPRYAVAYNEGFAHLNSPARGPRAGFDQNRIFLGMGRDGSRAKVEAGYQHVWLRRYGTRDAHIHCIVLNTFLWPFAGT